MLPRVARNFARFRPALQLSVVLALFQCAPAYALTNNLALTPPMGWNDWNAFMCNINETIVEQTADAMATNGLLAAGYQFVNVDDCWAGSRDSNGVLVADATNFPSGIKALADYVHARGLKLGVYTDHGTKTCAGRPASYGYEYLDAMTFASWGVDYLKNDSCNQPAGDVHLTDYFRMADGLMRSGRPIVVSICQNREHFEYWCPDQGNLWRTMGDIRDAFSSFQGILSPNSTTAVLAGPGRWNDPDMLQIGNGGMTDTEYHTHFSMWCMMAAPLLAGTDVRNPSAATLSILAKAELIAVDQDPAGEQGVLVAPGSVQVWCKPLGFDFSTKAVALYNPLGTPQNITVNWTSLGLQDIPASVRDLWAGADLGTFPDSFTTNVPSHGTVMLKVTGTPPPLPNPGTNYLSDLQAAYAYVISNNVRLTVHQDTSMGGNPLTLNGHTYAKGLGVNSVSGAEYDLGGIASRFQSDIGIDDEMGTNGTVLFQVFADGQRIYSSAPLSGGQQHQSLDLDVTGVIRLTLAVVDTNRDAAPNPVTRAKNNHADWAGALVIVTNLTPVPPTAPAGLTASGGNQSVNLSWNAVRSAAAYRVKRSTSPSGPYLAIATAPAAVYADTNVTLGVTYYYSVSATNLIGESSNSPPIAFSACSPPGTPSGLAASTNGTQVLLTWSPAAGATSHNVSRFTSNTPPILIASGISSNQYTDVTAPGGTPCFYVATAQNSCGQSGYSDFVAATVLPRPQLSILATGAGLAFSVANGLPGNSYYLLTTTNLSLPASNWPRVMTNSFDSNGVSQFTNSAVGPVQKQFYLIQLQ